MLQCNNPVTGLKVPQSVATTQVGLAASLIVALLIAWRVWDARSGSLARH